ncbi:hypothetical protein TOK_0935 [Pseudonocardia sp. N23]|nr:hypothetical protein TOK_0935 [Pseudonocardia sp. N23]
MSRTTLVVAAVAVWFLLCTAVLGGFAAIATLGGALVGGCGGDGGTGGGSQQIGPRSWSAEQTANAQTIVEIAVARALPRRAAVIAVATAIVESQLNNVTYGDRDSLGLFQQRPSQSWGSPATILNPALATATFYDRLLQVPGWASMPAGVAEQAVQRSAFPERYAPAETPAAALVERFWKGPDNPVPPADAAIVSGADAQAAAFATLGCSDQGGSSIQLSPEDLDRHHMPPGFTLPADPPQRAAVSYVISKIGASYVWGAKGPNAFDCSGLMLAAWASAGVPIPAGTVAQRNAGTPVGSLSQLAPGDLLLTPGSLGSATNPRHVGMYVGHGVVVDAYDSSTGVIVSPLSKWTPQIVTIRHIAGPAGEPSTSSALAAGATR